MTKNRLPLWLKIAYSIWLFAWLPVYVATHAPIEFLWFCHIGNIVILFGLWYENSLLISWQAVSLLVLQSMWTVDFFGRLVVGAHLFGATTYMFRDDFPWYQWLLSSYHIPFPFLLAYVLWKLGYDRRAFLWQAVATVVILAASFVFDTREPKWNINWVYGLGNQRQTWANDYLHVILCMIGYTIVVYFPSHLLFRWFVPQRRSAVERNLDVDPATEKKEPVAVNL
jgi:hypothetical protein